MNAAITSLLSLLIPMKRKSRYDRRNDPPSDLEPNIDAVYSAITSSESGAIGPLVKLVKQMLANDGHIQTELAKRKLALLGDPLTFRPASKKPDDVKAADECKKWADDYSGFTDAMLFQLDGVVWWNATSEKVFSPGTNGRRFDLSLEPVDPALHDYREGYFKIQTTRDGTPTGDVDAVDPARYWVYRGHPSTLSDQRGGPARALLFWHFMSHCSWGWWGRFLERFGMPVMVASVDNMDSDEVWKLEAAFGQIARLHGVVVSKQTEIKMMEAKANDGGRAYEAMHRLAQEEKSKILLGGIAGTHGVKSGLNSNSAETLDKVRGEFRAWDSFRLGTSLRNNVLRQFMHVNAIPGAPPTPCWGDMGASENEIAGDLLEKLDRIGIIPAEDALDTISQAAGVPLRWKSAPDPRNPRGQSALEAEHQLAAALLPHRHDPFPWSMLRN